MSHDLISDSIFHLNNGNAAFQAHMTDTFRGSLGLALEAFAKKHLPERIYLNFTFSISMSLENF